MDGSVSFSEALGNVFWVMGEFLFKLVPGTVASLTGSGTTGAPIPTDGPAITEPVTTDQVLSFLQQSQQNDSYTTLVQNWNTFVAFSMLISLLFATGIIYCAIRIRQLRHQEHLKFAAAARTVAVEDTPKTQLRWNRIMQQVESDNHQNWRLAILEADIMLNELLDLQGYKGETMADKMKQVNPAGFRTIDQAWEAHKVRNRVAHQGEALQLNERELRRVIGLYRQVFREFKLID